MGVRAGVVEKRVARARVAVDAEARSAALERGLERVHVGLGHHRIFGAEGREQRHP
jgi:hypothetical protein